MIENGLFLIVMLVVAVFALIGFGVVCYVLTMESHKPSDTVVTEEDIRRWKKAQKTRKRRDQQVDRLLKAGVLDVKMVEPRHPRV